MKETKNVDKQDRYYAFGKRTTKQRMEKMCFKSSVLKYDCCKKHCGSNIC